jgi:hypothetical protein
MAYPVTYDVDRPEKYNRLTVLFRIILVIPQAILVGGTGIFAGASATQAVRDNVGLQFSLSILNGGILSTIAGILVFISWFAILITARYPEAFRGFVAMVFRWTMNVHAYLALQTNPYPPFSGTAPYDLRVSVTSPERHNRLTVLFRLFLLIPHAIILAFLQIAQFVVTVIAWFAILFTGQYPASMYSFSVGVSRWYARFFAYGELLVDDYPPFSLAADPSAGEAQPRMA